MHRESLTLLSALSKPATLLDDVQASLGKELPWPLTDAARVDIASWIIRVHRPHLLLLHIFETDDAQHEKGPGSPEALRAIEDADRNVARLLEAVDGAGIRARTNIIVVSDHGFLPLGQQLQLNALFKREGWLETDAAGRITKWDVYAHPSGGSTFVLLKNPGDTALRDRVRAALDKVAADQANGVERILGSDDLRDDRRGSARQLWRRHASRLLHRRRARPAARADGVEGRAWVPSVAARTARDADHGRTAGAESG